MKKVRNNQHQHREPTSTELLLVESDTVNDNYVREKLKSKTWITFTIAFILLAVVIAIAVVIFLVVDKLPPVLSA